MELPNFDYTTEARFLLSLGVLLVFGGLFVALYSLIQVKDVNPLRFHSSFTTFFVVFLVCGFMLISYGLFMLGKDTRWKRKFDTERSISDILDQDLKLIELNLKEMEYNDKLKKYNETHKQNLSPKILRKFPDIARQAMDPKFYEKTYPKYKS